VAPGYHAAVTSACLTDAQLARLRDSAPGAAPPELAQHLSGCERCQARALFGAERPAGQRREPPKLPSLKRSLLLLALVLLALSAFFWTLGRLIGRGIQ
jgi:hypothetical protein